MNFHWENGAKWSREFEAMWTGRSTKRYWYWPQKPKNQDSMNLFKNHHVLWLLKASKEDVFNVTKLDWSPLSFHNSEVCSISKWSILNPHNLNKEGKSISDKTVNVGKVSYVDMWWKVKRITYSRFLTAYFYYLIGITAPGNTVFHNELNKNVLMTFVV